ncbi:MAG: DNA-processing protein DprA [Candidatus Accumulibacter sp.]|nr:DNA-processing protein DprA [Accumulibacter sp.]
MAAAEALAGWLRLTLIPGIGGETQRKLLKAFGLPEAIFGAGRGALSAVIGDKATRLLLDTDNHADVASALAWANHGDHHLLHLADTDYPQALLEIPDPPALLYVRGRADLLNAPALAMVGSRNPTPQGASNAERFAAAFAQAGLTIASGLALGIDAAAHRGALAASGNTVAFVGTGIDRLYPAANRQLALEIAARGTVVSELPIGTPPVAANFPRRNRLISGFSRGTLVVEATVDSGSLITARLAAEQGREVFAVPGSIHSPQARGCHKLIRQGAKLVETVQDVLDEIAWSSLAGSPGGVSAGGAVTSGQDAGQLLLAMGFDPCSLDELTKRTGLTADVVSVMLLHLELDGQVAGLAGGRYQRIPQA